MAATAVRLPTGQKVRTSSKSPMVLFIDYGDGAYILKRSANRATLLAERSKRPSARAFIVFTNGSGRVEEI